MSKHPGLVVELRNAGQNGQVEYFVFEPRDTWPPQVIEMNSRLYMYSGDSFMGDPKIRVYRYTEVPTYLRFLIPMRGSSTVESALKGARVN